MGQSGFIYGETGLFAFTHTHAPRRAHTPALTHTHTHSALCTPACPCCLPTFYTHTFSPHTTIHTMPACHTPPSSSLTPFLFYVLCVHHALSLSPSLPSLSIPTLHGPPPPISGILHDFVVGTLLALTDILKQLWAFSLCMLYHYLLCMHLFDFYKTDTLFCFVAWLFAFLKNGMLLCMACVS